MRPLVLTDLGAVGPWGAGVDALAEALASGAPRTVPVGAVGPLGGPTEGDGPRLELDPAVAWAGLVDPTSFAERLPARLARRMSPPSRFAVAAASEALEDAGFPAVPGAFAKAGSDVEPFGDDAGVYFATSFGPSSVTESLLTQILHHSPESASPFDFAESVANAPAAQAARLFGARGGNLTFTQQEAGPWLAAKQAAVEIRAGRASRALVGAVDEVTPILQAILDRVYGVLARAEDDDSPPVPRPFDRRRTGLLTAEGAAVALVEPLETARRRGARIRALLGPTAGAFDPTAPRHGWGTGVDALAGSLGRFLERLPGGKASIDRIVSGAGGSPTGDLLEARVLARVWGDTPLPPILAPKAVTGSLAGGLLAAALLLAEGHPLGASPDGFEKDPELGIVPRHGAPLEPPCRVLVTSLALGGSATWTVLERPEETAG